MSHSRKFLVSGDHRVLVRKGCHISKGFNFSYLEPGPQCKALGRRKLVLSTNKITQHWSFLWSWTLVSTHSCFQLQMHLNRDNAQSLNISHTRNGLDSMLIQCPKYVLCGHSLKASTRVFIQCIQSRLHGHPLVPMFGHFVRGLKG